MLSKLPTVREEKTDLIDALSVLTILPTGRLKKAEGNDEKPQIVNEALNAMAQGLPAVSKMTMISKLFTEPMTADSLPETSEDRRCGKLASSFRASGSYYSHNRNRFLTHIAPIDGAVQQVIPRSSESSLLHAYHYCLLSGYPAESSMRVDVYWPHVVSNV